MNTASRVHRGKLFVISAPSGVGKTSLLAALMQDGNDDTSESEALFLSVSHTTRSPRVNEVDGKNYHFVTHAEFERLQVADEFLESAWVHGNWYGTRRKNVVEKLQEDKRVIIEIDVQGALQVKQAWENLTMIFILPPSLEVLRERLLKRNTDSLSTIEKRLSIAEQEIAQKEVFDYHLVNDDFATTLEELKRIIYA